ncbi:MAG: NDP-sugar synthase [Archaeoglobaceae archaeon]|nr:NDP-sugar synthase [Archaeoglobaceae archaeon]MCX8151630.1 NDP-sugar synthase [Archaeoglobaceae archaeon]MDW8013092.1 NDP-sugar synthase [Archaeoglobaceae archaeon]
MKVVILAGGYATRLWPITKNRAKPLLPLGKKKIIDLVFEKVRDFGDVLVSTNKRFEDDFRRWAEGKKVEIVVEETRSEEEKLGAVKALAEIAKEINDDLFVIAGDNVFDFNLQPLLEVFKETEDPVVALYDVGDLELAKRYGVAELSGDLVVDFEEKPLNPKSSLVGVAIYIFPEKVIPFLTKYSKERKDKADKLGEFLSYLCKIEKVRYVKFNGNWFDIGTPDSYIEAIKTFMENDVSRNVEVSRASKIIEPVVVEKNVRISGRSIIGPYTYIAEGCEIDSCDLSESVVFNGCILKKVTLWRSLIDSNCEIRNIELKSSIVGSNAKIQGG